MVADGVGQGGGVGHMFAEVVGVMSVGEGRGGGGGGDDVVVVVVVVDGGGSDGAAVVAAVVLMLSVALLEKASAMASAHFSRRDWRKRRIASLAAPVNRLCPVRATNRSGLPEPVSVHSDTSTFESVS